jgi:hypothetical protein
MAWKRSSVRSRPGPPKSLPKSLIYTAPETSSISDLVSIGVKSLGSCRPQPFSLCASLAGDFGFFLSCLEMEGAVARTPSGITRMYASEVVGKLHAVMPTRQTDDAKASGSGSPLLLVCECAAVTLGINHRLAVPRRSCRVRLESARNRIKPDAPASLPEGIEGICNPLAAGMIKSTKNRCCRLTPLRSSE